MANGQKKNRCFVLSVKKGVKIFAKEEGKEEGKKGG